MMMIKTIEKGKIKLMYNCCVIVGNDNVPGKCCKTITKEKTEKTWKEERRSDHVYKIRIWCVCNMYYVCMWALCIVLYCIVFVYDMMKWLRMNKQIL